MLSTAGLPFYHPCAELKGAAEALCFPRLHPPVVTTHVQGEPIDADLGMKMRALAKKKGT